MTVTDPRTRRVYFVRSEEQLLNLLARLAVRIAA